MKSLFTSLLLIALASCSGDDGGPQGPFTLTVTGAGGTHAVTAASDPAGILCGTGGTNCSAKFAAGTHIHLSASGDATCTAPTCTVSPGGDSCSDIVMDEDKTAALACP
jgi:hypothetical protein